MQAFVQLLLALLPVKADLDFCHEKATFIHPGRLRNLIPHSWGRVMTLTISLSGILLEEKLNKVTALWEKERVIFMQTWQVFQNRKYRKKDVKHKHLRSSPREGISFRYFSNKNPTITLQQLIVQSSSTVVTKIWVLVTKSHGASGRGGKPSFL